MPLRRPLVWLTTLTLALAASLAGQPAVAGPATELVERFNISFISIMKNDDPAPQPSRYWMLTDEVSENFNLPIMMQTVTGSRWRNAGESEKALLVDAFLRMSIGVHLARFEAYRGEYFETLGERDRPDGATLVQTNLVRPGRLDLPVTYVMQKFDDEWRIVDLILMGGISEIEVRKSEFASILARGGLTGLTARLNDQADRIFAQLPAPSGRAAVAKALVESE